MTTASIEINRTYYMLSSDTRTLGTNENPLWNLPFPLSTTTQNSYFTLEILNPVIPFSFPIIQSSNNTVNLIMTINGTPHTTSFTVPQGNYTIYTLSSQIQTNLQNLYITYNPSGTSVFSCVFDPNVEYNVFSVSLGGGGGDSSINVSFTDTFSFVLNMLGFPTSFSFSNTSSSNGPNHPNVTPVTQLYIRSNIYFTKNFEFVAGNTLQKYSNIISILNIATSFDSYIINTTLYNLQSRISLKNIPQLDLYITTSNQYVPFNLRGVPWSCTILFKEMIDTTGITNNQNIEEFTQKQQSYISQLRPQDLGIYIPPKIETLQETQTLQNVLTNTLADTSNFIIRQPEPTEQDIQETFQDLELIEHKLDMLVENAIGMELNLDNFEIPEINKNFNENILSEIINNEDESSQRSELQQPTQSDNNE